MRNDLGQQEVFCLPNTGVIEGARDDDWQAVEPQPRHVFHGQLADRVIIGGRRRRLLAQHPFGNIAIYVGTAGNQHTVRCLAAGCDGFEQVARAYQVDLVERIGCAVPDKRNGSQMHDDIRLHFGQQRTQARAVGKVDLVVVRGIQHLAARTDYFIATGSQLGRHVAAGETLNPCDKRAFTGHLHQNENPFSLRRRSASTIMRHSSSRLVFGSQPSTSLALAGLPISSSTSAGR
ncbi:hypothetical protein D3C81_1385170 [compost metagenome]